MNQHTGEEILSLMHDVKVAAVVTMGVAFVGFVIFMYRYIERQQDIFLGLKRAMGRPSANNGFLLLRLR